MKTRIQIALFCVAACCTSAAEAQTLEWIRQLGTSGYDASPGVSADGLGNVYISGYTDGSLGGTNAGEDDAFLTKYDEGGTLQWTRQLGTSRYDDSFGVSADGLGNIYISGSTTGSLGGPNAGDFDAFLTKYDAGGTLQWSRQLGSNRGDFSIDVSADDLGNVYITGITNGNLGGPNAGSGDAFLTKFSSSGMLQWTRQLGTSDQDHGWGVSPDGLGNVYISGWTMGSLGGPNAGSSDAFVSKYNADGNLQWIRQFGTSLGDNSLDVSADDSGNVYISGGIAHNLPGQPVAGDAFLAKYDANGNSQWMRQLGTSGTISGGGGVSTDGLGNIYLVGETTGSLGGPNAGSYDVFLSKYDASGTLLWIEQLGSSSWDGAVERVSADGQGNVYISGSTGGSLGGVIGGEADAFVAKFSSVPEPNALLLVALAAAGTFVPRRRLGRDLKRGNSDRSALNHREKE